MATAISLDTQTFLGHNQATYQDLRLALQLNLRRQLLLAVCDDPTLQLQLAQRLAADLSITPSSGPGYAEVSARRSIPSPMVSLRLDMARPDPVRQVLLWLKHHRLLKASADTIPAFQIVGLDQLTRQSSTIQNKFLSSLSYVDALITRLDCRLLIWAPRPWIGKIQQAAPGFWRSRSGLFEFAGYPTPSRPGPISFDIGKPEPGSLNAVDATGSQRLDAKVELPSFEQPGPANLPVGSGSTAPEPARPPAQSSPPSDPTPWTILPDDPSVPDAPPAAPGQPAAEAPGADSAAIANFRRQLHAKANTRPLPKPDSQPARPFTVVSDAPLPSVVMPPAIDKAEPPLPVTETVPDRVPPTIDDDLTEIQGPSTLPAKLPQPPAVHSDPGAPLNPRPAPATAIPPDLPPELAANAEVIDLWRYIQHLAAQDVGPLPLSRAYLGLAQKSRDLIEAGTNNPPLLDFAIDAYTKAIAGLLEGDKNWRDALNDLASLYWLRSQQEDNPGRVQDWLNRSIQAYQKALQGAKTSAGAETLLRIFSNLGTVYSLMAGLTEPQAQLESAQQAYAQALQYVSVDASPLEYANLQNSLGAVHWRLAQLGQPQHHLHHAINAYEEALRYRTPQTAPLDYAMIQNNLGIAYWSLAHHERPYLLLEHAITAYRGALQYRTVDHVPQACAATYNNLGTAYWDLAQQHSHQPDQRLDCLGHAVEAYENALDAADSALQNNASQALGFDVWATFHSAGVVHDQLAQGLSANQTDQRKQHLARALQHYLVAYQGWQDDSHQLEVLVAALVYNIHLTFEICGLPGQQTVLSQVPGELLPAILRQL